MQDRLKAFFSKLGFNYDSDFTGKNSLSVRLGKTNFLLYPVGDISNIYFVYLPVHGFADGLFEAHSLIWNDNKTEVFITVSDYETHLCSAKYKPDKNMPLSCKLASFNYGVSSPQINTEELGQLKKESIDYGFFWDFVRENLNENKRHSVDVDLLLNLLHLRTDLKKCVPYEKSYILIERCLFLKFLEDRHFLEPEALLEILKESDSRWLINKFKEINQALNGDIFVEEIFEIQDIPRDALQKLYDFFTSDYRNQIRIFPYNFSVLPIELLSNIYETFLKAGERIGGGVYYTPTVLVDIILNDTLQPLLKKKQYPTCMDFSCGSGVFLVKAYERLIAKHRCYSDFETKKRILKKCIFGIERDEVAARITIFSLYLKLLEGEDPDFLKKSIRNGSIKFPELFDKNIQKKNTLFDKITLKNEDGAVFHKFDVVVGNPPWGVNPFEDPEIGQSCEMNLAEDKLKAVTRFQSSQYFILKAQDFMSKDSIAGILSNNSNLLMTKSQPFRLKLLDDYDLETVYDFTHCNPILFKKRKLKTRYGIPTNSDEINLGADEPAVALILRKKGNSDRQALKYVTPSLNLLTKLLKVVSIKPSDVKTINRQLLKDDQIWRVLAVGDIEDYEVIQKLNKQGSESRLKAFYGFQFEKSGKTIWEHFDYFDKDSIDHFKLKRPKRIDQSGGAIRRPGKSIEGKVLVKRYIEKGLRVKAAYEPGKYKYKENLIGVTADALDSRILLGLCNSSLISYFLFHNSAQIGKGTFNMLHANEVENIPVPPDNAIPPDLKARVFEAIGKTRESDIIPQEVFSELDELVFDIYNLKEHEKQRVRDFFHIAKRRNMNALIVKDEDFCRYGDRFRSVFRFILRDDMFLNAEAFFSFTLGAGITFTIVDSGSSVKEILVTRDSNLVRIIIGTAKRQLKRAEKDKILKQEKLKLYSETSFTILKSNYYQDWTETEAIKDAREEIELFVQNLPDN